MDSHLIYGQRRKAGVDYAKCQAEFDAQMLLLKEDLKKRLNLAQNKHEGRKISDTSRSSSLVGKFIILVFQCLSLKEGHLQICTRDQKQSQNPQHDVPSVVVSCCGVSH